MNFKITSEWLRQTQENMNEERAYKTALANNESTDFFKIKKRARTSDKLVLKHDIPQYDNTLYNFISETSLTITNLNNRILELEQKLKELEKKE
jgi:hypothetical protein